MRTDLKIKKGDYFLASFTLKWTPSTNTNITNYKFIIKIRSSKNSEVVIDSWDETSAYIYRDNAGGTVAIYLPETYTDSMPDFGSGVLNIWFYDTQNTVGYESDEYSIAYEV